MSLPVATPELLARLGNRRVVASISGGKDSAAMSLHLRELGIDHDRVFMDTGWEADKTYEYLRGELARVLGPITEIRADKLMEDRCEERGMFPSRMRRFCTQELKVFPARDYLRARMDAGMDLVNAVGIRAAESRPRAAMVEWEWQETFDCDVWRPILRWSMQDVVDIHARHGLQPNPLYLLGASRVGCWPCIYARKSEIALIARVDPERIDRLEALEARIADMADARYAARGETRESLSFAKPAWFRQRLPDGEKLWPIRKVVEWSRTARGGKQMELFEVPPGDAGCMRWGLCETEPPDGGAQP